MNMLMVRMLEIGNRNLYVWWMSTDFIANLGALTSSNEISSRPNWMTRPVEDVRNPDDLVKY